MKEFNELIKGDVEWMIDQQKKNNNNNKKIHMLRF